MLDEELVDRGLNALFIALALMLQDAHQIAVGRMPKDAQGRMKMAKRLGDAARDLGVLAAAGEVLAARGVGGRSQHHLPASE